MRRFVVPREMPLSECLLAIGETTEALREGRVFVGKVRALDGAQRLVTGEAVSIGPKRRNTGEPIGGVVILYEDADIVALAKPAGMPTIPDHGGTVGTLLHRVASLLGCAMEDVHPTSRLDRDVSGVVVFAKTKSASAALLSARKDGLYRRTYVALAHGTVPSSEGTWTARIGRARDRRHRQVDGADSVDAETRFRVVATSHGVTLFALYPQTGRTHQLRVHCAHAGVPLLGDRIYGGSPRLTLSNGAVLGFERVALHALSVAIPLCGGLVIEDAVPPRMLEWWEKLGGSSEAWNNSW